MKTLVVTVLVVSIRASPSVPPGAGAHVMWDYGSLE